MKKIIAFGLSVLLLALVLAGWDNPIGGGNKDSESLPASVPPGSATYEYIKGGSTYKLTITQSTAKAAYTPVAGDTYLLLIITGGQTKTSSGTIASFLNSVFTLKPSNSTVTFTIQISGNAIVTVSGTITLEGSGGTVKGPDTGSGGGSGSGSVSGNSIVNESGGESFVGTVNSVDELAALLTSLSPYNVKTSYLISLNTSDITGIGTVLNNEPNKYVSLDLSGSTIKTIPVYAFSNKFTYEGSYTLTGIIIPDKRKMTHFTQLQG